MSSATTFACPWGLGNHRLFGKQRPLSSPGHCLSHVKAQATKPCAAGNDEASKSARKLRAIMPRPRALAAVQICPGPLKSTLALKPAAARDSRCRCGERGGTIS